MDFDRYRSVFIGGTLYELPDFFLRHPDLRLQAGSPALDAGAGEEAPPMDLLGTPRPCGAEVDIGAYEMCQDAALPFIRGDASADGKMDLSDPIRILNFLFGSPPLSTGCRSASDANDDGVMDISDALTVLLYLFVGAQPLAAPFPLCGADPTPDGLACGGDTSCL
jgi:hypothetical protein